MSRPVEATMGIVVSIKGDTYKIFTRVGLKVVASFTKFEIGELVEVYFWPYKNAIFNVSKIQ